MVTDTDPVQDYSRPVLYVVSLPRDLVNMMVYVTLIANVI